MGGILEWIATEAIRQGFTVSETELGQYIFRMGGTYVVVKPPATRAEARSILVDLVRVGLIWPPPHPGKSRGRHAKD